MQVAPVQQSLWVTQGYLPPPLLHVQTLLSQYWLQHAAPAPEQAAPTDAQPPLEEPPVELPPAEAPLPLAVVTP